MSSSQSPARLQPTDPLIGRVISGRFRVIELLARGGMGRVYRAEQVPLGRQVALKVLDRPPSAESDREFETRFLNEASTAAKLQHSNTVTVFDYGRSEDGICFIAMELVEGISLRDAIRVGAPFTSQRTVHIALQIARSLREAHKLEVIHRDLKPANVLLARHDDDEDFVKVLDFGLVKHVDNSDRENLTREGLFLGSPKYMAPEHILGERVDARADVYSLGVCMYEMLSGHPPYGHDNTVKILMAHMHEPVPVLRSATCPPALADLVARCLAKSPAARPASMEELIVELKRTIGSQSVHSGEYARPLDALARARLDAHSPSGSSGFRVPALPAPARPSSSEMRAAPLAPSLHQPLASVAAAEPAQAQVAAARSRKPLVARAAVVLLLVLAGAGLGLASIRERSDTVVGTATRAQPEASTVKMLDALPAPAAATSTQEASVGEAAHIFVRLDSHPSGAMVMFEGRAYGPTPANVEIEGPGVSRGSEVTFVFEKEGYEPVRISRLVRLQNLTIETDLSRMPEGKQAKHTSSSAPRASASAPAHVAAAAPAPAPVSVAAAVQQPAPTSPAPSRPAMALPAAPTATATATAQPPSALPVQATPSAPAPAPAAKPLALQVSKPSVPLPAGPDAVPEYPRAARRAGITGTVVARVNVGSDGKVQSVVILEGPSVFHEAVRAALSARRYTPARLSNGAAAADSHVVRVPFELK